MSSRNLITGAIVLAVIIVAGYFAYTAYEATSPQPAPSAQTQPKS